MLAKIKKYVTFQYKAMLVLMLLVSLPFLLTGYLVPNFAESQRIQEKENTLLTITHILADHIGPEGYAGILREHNATDASKEQKIKILNEVLSPFTEAIAAAAPNLGVGYYSQELDAILTYGPTAQYGHTVGIPIPPKHPGRTAMRTGQSLVRSGTMVRGAILNAMLPLTREGKIIGYIWANEPLTDVQAQLDALNTHIFTLMLAYGALCIGLLLLLSRRTLRDIDRIISGLRAMRTDFSQRIPDSRGELGEVARAINAMAVAVNATNAHLESKIAERTQELETERSFLRTVLDAIPDVVFYKSPEGRYIAVNIALATMVGKSKDTLIGLNDVEIFGNTPFAANCHTIDQRVIHERTAIRLEERVTTPAGNTLELETIKTPCLDAQGEVIGVLGISRDNIARKALEQALIRAREDALAASQAKSDFLANMSHEIRTPMSGIIGLVYLALNHADVTPRLRDYLQKVDMSAKSLLRIINDILDFSKIEAGKLEMERVVFSLPEVLEKTIQPLVPAITDKGLEIHIDIAAEVPNNLIGDPTRLGQVMLNLVSNALKFTHQGSIIVGVELVQAAAQEANLRINVTDTGIGMDPAALSRLFESFSQADTSITRRYGGTGLGLAICKRLVELMDGDIAVTSAPGNGTTFTISARFGIAHGLTIHHELRESLMDKTISPAPHPSAGPWDPKAPAPSPMQQLVGKRVLLAEDNEINQLVVVEILTAYGIQVRVAHNGLEAVAMAEGEPFDLIFMDVQMPEMDGISATRRIRKSANLAHIPIIAMTAHAMSGDIEKSLNAGMQDHITKPLDLPLLQATLLRWLLPSMPE